MLIYYRQCFAIFRVEQCCHQGRTSVVSSWKTESSGFHMPRLKPTLFHWKSSAEIWTSDSLRVICLIYTVGALKLPNQALSIFDRSSKKCVVRRCHDGRQHLSYYSIRAVFFQLPGVISLVVHSRVENQSSDQLEVAHGGRFPASPTTHDITLFGVNPGFTNAWAASPSLVHYLWRFRLLYETHFSSPVMRRFRNGSISLR